MEMKYSYKGLDFLINIDYKDFPQDGQRVISMLDSIANSMYERRKLDFFNSAIQPLSRIYDHYISYCHNMPKNIGVYFICEEIHKGRSDIDFTEKEFDKMILEFNIKWAKYTINLIEDRIKFMKRKLEFMEEQYDI